MIAFEVLTIFPAAIDSFVETGLLGRAIRSGRVAVRATDIREFSQDKHRRVDDTPYGGGAGMLMRVEPVVAALEHVDDDDRRRDGRTRRVLLAPAAPRFDQRAAERLATYDRVTLVCGRYEGIDDRVRAHVDEALSLGDFVLNGGEVAALAVIEAVARLREGVIGNEASARVESFADEPGAHVRLEHPQYTRPIEFRGDVVPAVLRGGDHERIARWRRQASWARTARWRPDLLGPAPAAPLEYRLAWPGRSRGALVSLGRGKVGAIRRALQRSSGRAVRVVTLDDGANPAALSGALLRRYLRDLTSSGERPVGAEPVVLVVPPGVGDPEVALAVPPEIFDLAKQASMIDISPPPDPGPLLVELDRALSGHEEIP